MPEEGVNDEFQRAMDEAFLRMRERELIARRDREQGRRRGAAVRAVPNLGGAVEGFVRGVDPVVEQPIENNPWRNRPIFIHEGGQPQELNPVLEPQQVAVHIDNDFYTYTYDSTYKTIKDHFKKELKEIDFDDEKMIDIKLTSGEVAKAICSDLDKYYKKYVTDKANGFKPVNGIVSFNDPNHTNKLKKPTTFVGIVIGYSFNNKIYNTASEIANTQYIPDRVTAIIKAYDEKSNRFKTYRVSMLKLSNWYATAEFLKKLKIKIIGGELSGKVFGKSQEKIELTDSYFRTFELTQGKSKKIGETYYITVNIKDQLNNKKLEFLPDQELKFVLSDVEFVLPNVKGYVEPIDKTIKKGSHVIVTNPKFSLHKHRLYVNAVKSDNTSKRINKNSTNRRLDIISCVTNMGEPLRLYAKDLKAITK